MSDVGTKDWKLKLRYGKLKTPYSHFTAIADGIVGTLAEGYECRPGAAFMGVKVWASSIDDVEDMVKAIGGNIGFSVKGRTSIYDTAPEQPPREMPYGYDINFTPYDPE